LELLLTHSRLGPRAFALGTLIALLLGHSANAADATWRSNPFSGNWVPLVLPNWSTGLLTFPGATSGTTNSDTATFLTSNITSITINNSSLNINSITFGVSGSTPDAFTVGTTGGNSLLLSSGGTIAISSGITGTNIAETVNAPLVLEPASATTAGTYTFSNDASSTTNTLNIGGAISGGTTTQSITLTLTGANTGTNTVSGVISNGGAVGGVGVNKTGTGSWTLSGANTYTGATTVNAGSLFVNGSTASGSAVTVNNSGSTLGGNGTISGSVNVASSGANLSPGATGGGSTAILHTGALTLSSGSNFNVDLNSGGTAGTNYDQVRITGSGTITLSNLVVTAGSGLAVNDKFFIMLDNTGSTITGTFAQGATVTANNGNIFAINYADNGDDGPLANDISLTLTAIPEPGTWVAGGLAFAALAFTQRRRWRSLLRR
jgi:autotransporter-associated beta strand protein